MRYVCFSSVVVVCIYRPQDFAKARGATYPVLAKVDVNGFGAIPLYKFLKEKQGGSLGINAIKWNFTKYVREVIVAVAQGHRTCVGNTSSHCASLCYVVQVSSVV